MIVQSIIKFIVIIAGLGLIYVAFFTKIVDKKIRGTIETEWFKVTNIGTKVLLALVGLALIFIVINKGSKETIFPDGTRVLEMKQELDYDPREGNQP